MICCSRLVPCVADFEIVTHNAREFIRVGGVGLEDWRSP